jgi:hypothetical protein
MVALEFHQPGSQRGANIAQANAEVEMIRIIGLAVVLISLSKITLAADDPAYVAPPPTGDPKSTIVSGILMIVNGIIMAEAGRRHQDCATLVSGWTRVGFRCFATPAAYRITTPANRIDH